MDKDQSLLQIAMTDATSFKKWAKDREQYNEGQKTDG